MSCEAPAGCAPFVDRDRCEGKAECVRRCPFGVFEIRALAAEDRAALSLKGKLKAWAHGGKQAYAVKPGECRACRLCVESCPEKAIELRPWKNPR
jgi:NAD-dependent dihydropyrimidine dehydrogenase PreA subunit